MFLQIAAPNVDDERHVGFERGDICEILIRRDAEVDAASRKRPQLGNDVLEKSLVADDVVRLKVAVRLGDIVDERPELLIAEPIGQPCGAANRLRRLPRRNRDEREDNGDGKR